MLLHFQLSTADLTRGCVSNDKTYCGWTKILKPACSIKGDSLFWLSNMPACDVVSATMSLVKPQLGLAITVQSLCKATVTVTEWQKGLTAWTRWLLGSAVLGRRDSLNPKILWGLETWRPAGRHGKAQLQYTQEVFEQFSKACVLCLLQQTHNV